MPQKDTDERKGDAPPSRTEQFPGYAKILKGADDPLEAFEQYGREEAAKTLAGGEQI